MDSQLERPTPRRWWGMYPTDRALLVGTVLLLLITGGQVLKTTGLKSKTLPRGDLQVFLRAAWAVRAGEDIYQVTDSHGWHYNYPPALAVLAVPLADPPPWVDGAGYVPFAVSTVAWYLLSLAALVAGAALAGRALDRADAGRGPPEPWWRVRIRPMVACLPAVVITLQRGQVNLFLLCTVGAALYGFAYNRRGLAGAALGAAACLKVFPAFLLVYPARRRDYRCLAGAAAALVVGLVLIPAAGLGPVRAWAPATTRPGTTSGSTGPPTTAIRLPTRCTAFVTPTGRPGRTGRLPNCGRRTGCWEPPSPF